MKLLFTSVCLLAVLSVNAKRKNVNCEKLQRKCDRGSSKACRKLGKLCSDFLKKQEDSAGSSQVGAHVQLAGLTGSHRVPGGIFVEVYGTSIEVAWIPPENNGAPIRGYVLGYGEYIPDAETVRLAADVTSYIIEDVSPNVIYVIKLRSFDDNGYGPSIYQTIMTRDASELPETHNEDTPGQTVETAEDETTNHEDGVITAESEGDKTSGKIQSFGTTVIPDDGRHAADETS